MKALVLLIYNVLLPVGLLVAAPGAWRKLRRRGGAGSAFLQRFGRYGEPERRALRHPQDVWIHAVSVGEVNIAGKVIEALHRRDPALRLTLSTTTPTGFAVATARPAPNVTVIHNPLDLPWIVERAMEVIRPRRLVLVEAEIWPNLVAAAGRSGVPVTLVNARMSDRSGRRFRAFRWFVAPIFAMVDRILTQHPGDAGRWIAAGAREDAIECVGSVKFDPEGAGPVVAPDEFRMLLDGLWPGRGDPLVLAASTHAGEERLIARAWRRLRAARPGSRLVVVPRHFERAGEVVAELAADGFSVIRRSAAGDEAATRAASDEPPVLLVDTTGELTRWIDLADLVVIGKSFLGRGGQNPVEAILARKPVVFGPHMENFRDLARELLANQAASRVEGECADDWVTGLAGRLERLAGHPEEGRAQVGRAVDLLEQHRGACARTAKILLRPAE